MATTMKPTISGARLPLTGALYSSLTARMKATRKAVPAIWSSSGIHAFLKYGAGVVPKMPKVAAPSAELRVISSAGLVGGDRVVVEQEDERGAEEGADDLRGPEAGDAVPREVAPQRHGDGDRRVEVRAGDAAGRVDGEADREAPAQADQQPVAAGLERERATLGLVERGHAHRHRTAAEGDQQEGAERLRDQIAEDRPLPATALHETRSSLRKRVRKPRPSRTPSTRGQPRAPAHGDVRRRGHRRRRRGRRLRARRRGARARRRADRGARLRLRAPRRVRPSSSTAGCATSSSRSSGSCGRR